MEPWLIITLIVAAVIILAIIAWLVVALFAASTVRKQWKRMDQEFETFSNSKSFRGW